MLRPEAETHFLGLMIAASQLRRAGWLVKVDLTGNRESVSNTLLTDTFDVICLTVGTARALRSAEEMIRTIRQAAPQTKLVLGGMLTELNPELCPALDVDMTVHTSDPIVARLADDHALATE